MTRPGRRLHRLAARLCSERTMRRWIDPAVADLQAEFAEARGGSAWRRARVLALGYSAITKILAIAWVRDGVGAAGWELEEWRVVRRALVAAIVGVATFTLLLAIPQIQGHSLSPSLSTVLLSLYLVPSILALSLPLGLAVAAAWSLHGGHLTSRLAAATLAGALVCSLAMFANMEWVIPDANQAFRETVWAHESSNDLRPVQRGDNELTLGQLKQRRAEIARGEHRGRSLRRFDVGYFRRWAFPFATLAIVAVIVALAARRVWTRAGLTSAALGVCAVYYALLLNIGWYSASTDAIPPWVANWLPNAVCALAAALLGLAPRRPQPVS